MTISVLNTDSHPRVFEAVVSGPVADWEPGEICLIVKGSLR